MYYTIMLVHHIIRKMQQFFEIIVNIFNIIRDISQSTLTFLQTFVLKL